MTTKRNTISVTLPDEDYDALKALADEQDRYISGQARHMLRAALRDSQAVAYGRGVSAVFDAAAPDDNSQPEIPTRAGEPDPEGGPTEAELRSPTRAKGVPVQKPPPG